MEDMLSDIKIIKEAEDYHDYKKGILYYICANDKKNTVENSIYQNISNLVKQNESIPVSAFQDVTRPILSALLFDAYNYDNINALRQIISFSDPIRPLILLLMLKFKYNILSNEDSVLTEDIDESPKNKLIAAEFIKSNNITSLFDDMNNFDEEISEFDDIYIDYDIDEELENMFDFDDY